MPQTLKHIQYHSKNATDRIDLKTGSKYQKIGLNCPIWRWVYGKFAFEV